MEVYTASQRKRHSFTSLYLEYNFQMTFTIIISTKLLVD